MRRARIARGHEGHQRSNWVRSSVAAIARYAAVRGGRRYETANGFATVVSSASLASWTDELIGCSSAAQPQHNPNFT
jgi:hypothetical protein